MFFQRVKTKGLGHNAYVLGCGEGLAVVVDPRRDVDDYLALARQNNPQQRLGPADEPAGGLRIRLTQSG